MRKCRIAFSIVVALFFLSSASSTLEAQANLICDGSVQTLTASGTFEDLIIPEDSSVTQIELVVHGADGGFADLGNGCFSEGGAGAHAVARFDLGEAEGAIPYGSTLRFVVGVAGEKGTGGTILGTGNTYGGGGGGTGILYRKPGSDQWDVLMVAGGGGGAYQGSFIGICVDSKTGQGGRSGLNGGNGNGGNGGPGGMVGAGGLAGGLDGLEVSGGGGGAYAKGEGITCVNFDGSNEVAEGQQGFPNGGAGGGNEGCIGSTFRDGGFGFGGGASGQGGGGGGGGFSGGGGGGSAGRGGGGGSYILDIGINPLVEEGGLSATTEDGFAQYRCIKRTEPVDDTPVASCIDTIITISLNTAGVASVIPAQISAEPLDPALSYLLSGTEYTCDSLGERTISLIVQNEAGLADTCTATILVVDELAPEVNCPASAAVSCEADSSVTALGTATAVDNCGVATLELEEVVSGGECPQELTITRTWTATDASGNAITCDQVIVVTDGVAPTCSDCPADVTVACDAVPEVPEISVSDNCDPEPSVALEISTTQTDAGCTAYSYVETRTWTVTDACGNAASFTQIVTVVDDQAPSCLNCPEDVTVSCEAVPEIPALEVTDNCDPDPSVELSVTTTQTDDRSCGYYSYTETRRWTISDACGNSIEHTQVITVEDTSAPDMTCPPATTVTCDNDPAVAGIPEVLDNCDPSPNLIYEDEVLSGNCDWACTIERTWTVTDACGNSNACIQIIEQSVLELVEDALAEDLNGDGLADPLVIGRLNRHSLTVTEDGAACLVGWMPNNGGAAWPLVRADLVADGEDCSPTGLPLGEDGKLNNPLIAETLILGIKLRLDPAVGAVLLSDLDCNFHPIVFQGLPRNPTVADLYAQANLVVGNIIGLPFTEYFAAALACINGTYGLCNESEEDEASALVSDAASRLQMGPAVVENPQIGIYPNPARGQFWLDLGAFDGQSGQLSLFNATGQRVMERQLREITSGPVLIPVEDLSSGLYLIQLRIGDHTLTEQIVLQGY